MTALSERHRVTATASVDLSDDPGLVATLLNPATAAAEESRNAAANLTRRAAGGFAAPARALRVLAEWLLTSREDTNYTYDLTALILVHLAHAVAVVTGRPPAEIRAYIDEPGHDAVLRGHLEARHDQSPIENRVRADRTLRFGRRLGWYAVARCLRPRLIVETGVDKGLGAALLCTALRRNADEGHIGRYLGLDIRASAGYLLQGPPSDFGSVMIGDAIASLASIDAPVDLFINDSDHAPDYEAREYRAIETKLSATAIVIGDNAHSTDELANFADRTGRRFLFFREQPDRHWYPGAGIGFAFR
jgi:predicted O-methyltransferase YrrM